MISDELFNELYGYKGGLQAYNEEQIIEGFCPLNKYELAHKCKDWASEKIKPYIVYSGKDGSKWFCIAENKNGDNKQYYKDTEIEAIIEMCEFILKNR